MEGLLKPYTEKFESVVLKNPTVDHYLTILESKTKVKKYYLAYGILGALVFWLMFGYGAALLCNLIGFVYPAYCSIKALETRSKDDDTQWLIYWVVFAVFSVLEFFSDILMGWVPFYWFSKCLFLVWCMSPLNGAEKIYRTMVLPWFKANQTAVDKAIDEGRQGISGLTQEAMKMAAEAAAEVKKDM